MLLALLACVSTPNAPDLPVVEVGLEVPPPEVGLVRVLDVRADRAVQVTLELDDGLAVRQLTWPTVAPDLRIPLFELHADTTYTLRGTATDAEGRATALSEQTFSTGGLPPRMPDLDALVHLPDRMEPGLTLVPVTVTGTTPGGLLLALDRELRVVYWWDSQEMTFYDSRMLPDGDISILHGGQVRRLDPAGEVVSDFGIAGEEMHHEVFPARDGTWLSLVSVRTPLDAYPTSYQDPSDVAPADVEDNPVVRFTETGVELSRFSLLERLDPLRISWGSLYDWRDGMDWAHANAVIEDPVDGGVIVSVRHQDCVVKLDADGELVWILGDPGGWTAPWSDYLLQPVGDDFTWQYQQHAHEMHADGTIVMFDNDGEGHTPYGPPPGGYVERSRVVGFRIDEAARTVEQLWSFEETTTGLEYSHALGDADLLPGGTVLSTWGWLKEGDPERGEFSARLIEFDPATLDTVLDLEFSTAVQDNPIGWQIYRARRIRSLYPDGVGWAPR